MVSGSAKQFKTIKPMITSSKDNFENNISILIKFLRFYCRSSSVKSFFKCQMCNQCPFMMGSILHVKEGIVNALE